MVYAETIFIVSMELSIIFNEKVSVKNKFHLKQTNSSLFAIILFL